MATVLTPSPAYVLQQLLIEVGQAADPEDVLELWPAYIGFLPNTNISKNNSIVLYDRDGKQDHSIIHPGIKIKIRASTYLGGYAKAKNISQFLDGIKRHEITVENRTYRIDSISRYDGIEARGEDSNGLNIFDLRMHVTINEI